MPTATPARLPLAAFRNIGLGGLKVPTVITGLAFDELQSPDSLDRLLDVEFVVKQNVRDNLSNGVIRQEGRVTMPLRDYFNGCHPRPLAMVQDAPPPAFMRDAIALPDALLPARATRLFAGRAGCVTDLHFDWVGHWLLMQPLFGRKRFTFLPPAAGRTMLPRGNFAGIAFHDFDAEERARTLMLHGGFEIDLEPDEVLLQPPFWWHHVLYLEDAATLSIGVGAVNADVARLMADPACPAIGSWGCCSCRYRPPLHYRPTSRKCSTSCGRGLRDRPRTDRHRLFEH